MLSEETVLSLDYIAWQTYELGHSGLDSFFEAVRRSHPNVFKEAMGKSIVTELLKEQWISITLPSNRAIIRLVE